MSGYSDRGSVFDWFPLIALGGGIILVAGFITLMIGVSIDKDHQQQQSYQECKQRTSDIEWCMKDVFGVEIKK